MKRPRRQCFVVLPEGEKYPMKEWLRENPEHIPEGMHPDTHVYRQLRHGLEQNGWEVKESDTEVHLIFPTKEGEGDLESVIKLLRESMSVITPLGAWTQGTLARMESGSMASISDSNATQFCMVGALRRGISNLNVSNEVLLHAYKIVHEEIRAANSDTRTPNPRNANHESAIMGYNDTSKRKQREVVNVLDNAIFEAEMQEFKRFLSKL
jgi:hypothetical protein